jgi:hypothetical protein
MSVVDGVEHQVFVVPAEGRVAHSDVKPRNINPADVVGAWELHQGVSLFRQVVQIPGMVQLGLYAGTSDFLASTSKARSKFLSGDICRVLDACVLPHIILDHVPILLL